MEIHADGEASGEFQAGPSALDETVLLSSRFFRTLLETIPSPIFFKDAQGRYLGCNDAFVDYLGLSRQEIVGRTVYDIAPRELADIYQLKDQELFDHPGVQVYESRVRYADGSMHDVIFRKSTFHDAEGRVSGLVGVVFDITDRTHRIVADNTYDWEIWLRPDGRFGYCSPSCERITGHSREAFLEDPGLLQRIIHPEDRGIFQNHWRGMQDESVRDTGEIHFRLIRPDGSFRWIGQVSQPVFDDGGRFQGSRASNRDITEQKQAEEALRKSETALKEAQRLAQIGSWEWNATTDTISWSEEYYRIYGFDPARRPPGYVDHLQAYTPESAARLDAAVKRNMQTGEPYELDLELAHAEGPSRWITARSETKRDAQGRIIGLRGTAQDITDRKRIQEDLFASERRYRALFNEMTEGFALHEFVCDESGAPRDFRFLEINPAFERLTGLLREDVVGRLVSEILPDEAPLWVRLSSEVALTGESSHFENYVPALGKYFEVFAYRPALRQFAVLFMDITERKRSDQERERLLSQLRAVIDHIDTGLIITDIRGKVLEMNPAARDLLGYANLEQAQRHPVESRARYDLISMDGRKLTLKNWPRARTLRGETFSNWELRVRNKKTGLEWICNFGGTPVKNKDGQVAFTLVTLRDVTERQKAHEELERKVRERTAELDRFNRTLQGIADCNQAIIRATSEQELLQEFCRISMNVEGVDLAWVGLAQNDAARSVRPAASVGFLMSELGNARISWAEDAFGQGPASLAIRTGQLCILPNLLKDPDLFIQREEHLNLGFGSTLALPLRSGNCTFGALVLYTSKPEIFVGGQIRTLQELANNLSIGVSTLRTQEERDRALRTAESRAEQLRGLTLELTQTEQRERRRLAQILHDNLQQLLVGATFSVEVLKGKLRTGAARKTIEQLSETLSEALNVSRVTTMELSPPIFHEKGLSEGLEWLGSQMHKKHGLKVAIEVARNAEPEAEQVRMFVFEAVRELLLNVIKHAKVDHARVRVRPLENEELEVTVADKGIGFDAARCGTCAPVPEGFGLFNIRERIKGLQGHMEIESIPGGGSRITLVVPSGGWQKDPLEDRLPR